jgi:hypothetical protein
MRGGFHHPMNGANQKPAEAGWCCVSPVFSLAVNVRVRSAAHPPNGTDGWLVR